MTAQLDQLDRGRYSSSKCTLVFYHRDHKERREVADLRLICRFFVFTNPRMCFVVECVLHLELLRPIYYQRRHVRLTWKETKYGIRYTKKLP